MRLMESSQSALTGVVSIQEHLSPLGTPQEYLYWDIGISILEYL